MKITKFKKLIPNSKQLIKLKIESILMDKLKSLKNYLSPSSASNSPTSEENPISDLAQTQPESSPDPTKQNDTPKTLNSRFQKSLNDSTRKISTLLQFTRSASIKNRKQELENPSSNSDSTKRLTRPKFFRSTSFTSSSVSKSKKNYNLDMLDLESESKQTIFDLDPDYLFNQLGHITSILIDHFKQICDLDSIPDNFNFMQTLDQTAQTYLKLALHSKYMVDKCFVLYKKIELNVDKYDYDTKIKANGYRSLLRVFDSCSMRLLVALNDLNERKTKFYFQLKLNNANLPASFLNSNLIKEIQTWLRLMEKLYIVLETGLEMQTTTLKLFEQRIDNENTNSIIKIKHFHDDPSLFVHLNQIKGKKIEENLFSLASEHQEAFFGRACGFQYCDSLQKPLTGCAIALASYNDGFEAFSNKENTIQASNLSPGLKRVSSVSSATSTSSNSYTSFSSIGKAAMSVYSSTRYMIDPDLRAKKMSHVMRKANVEFCKAFWQLTETSIVQMGSNLVTPTLAINVVKKINLAQVLKLPKFVNGKMQEDFVDINPPNGILKDETIKIRILSNEMRPGMQDLDKLQTIESPVSFSNQTQTSLSNYEQSNKNLSRNLILHVHGGGFIAHSSKSHEIYLKPWCKELKVPIVSIDYSLAPEYAFPRASEECFYVYAWCLLNKNLLGWTGENIICVGDSAGGVLVTNIVQRAINNQTRVPDALIPIYAPFLLTYSLSPSRLLSVMDPLLNLGILWRCLAAYSGIDFKTVTEKYKYMLNIVDDKIDPSNSKLLNHTLNIRNSKSDLFDNVVGNDQEKIVFNNNSENNSDENSEETEDYIFKIAPLNKKASNQHLFNKEELLSFYQQLGESIFLIDKLRYHEVTYDQYMSPILSGDDVLSKFPRTCLIACNDPFLDDSIEMYKSLKRLNVDADLLVVDNGSPHGFLNMQSISDETHEAYEEALAYLKYICENFTEIKNKSL